MAKQPRFTLEFPPEAIEQLDPIERKYHRLIREAINEQLLHTPTRETRNRKPLEQPAPFTASWELRCGPKNCFRVFYEVDSEEHTVRVLAIGLKVRNQLFIGGEEYTS
jgi:mRNA-degrading endonuclease RelE of RelBE toxin-antitoxin system